MPIGQPKALDVFSCQGLFLLIGNAKGGSQGSHFGKEE